MTSQPDPCGTEALSLALAIIRKWEGLELVAYADPATGGSPFTVGYGATGPDIKPGTVWTLEQAEHDLKERVKLMIQRIRALVVKEPTPSQLAAMTSLAYNVGAAAFASSTLLRLFNAGSHERAAEEFPRWNKAAGKVMRGLVNRRADERRLFLGQSVEGVTA